MKEVRGAVHDGGKHAAVELWGVAAFLHALDHEDVLAEHLLPHGGVFRADVCVSRGGRGLCRGVVKFDVLDRAVMRRRI